MKRGGFRDPAVAFVITLVISIIAITVLSETGPTGMLSIEQPDFELQTSHTLQLLMPKNSINCSARIFQDADNVTLYTCGDKPNVGGTITCDLNASGSSSTNPTNATTCSRQNAFGAFFLTNNGTNATLNATVLNITLSGSSNNQISLDNTLYSAVGSPGCAGASCNNCPAPDTLGCFKDVDPASPTPNSVLECDNFVSGGSVCQCFSIHVVEPALHRMRAGEDFQFAVLKTLGSPALNPCP